METKRTEVEVIYRVHKAIPEWGASPGDQVVHRVFSGGTRSTALVRFLRDELEQVSSRQPDALEVLRGPEIKTRRDGPPNMVERRRTPGGLHLLP